ncbi:restriction endonuclease subunit S [Gelidibacter japonicus]|uniref:restriction endonuclease subunit S n=1 Tax=Gelidibacter japonicus TaxID=1962232 RepID=UPI002021DDD2|nr:restriction endonuclease subunit S [Gelidibacter japonicus]MCL8009180.1 restriction endonuclease subunit S [Gelidibacter japonicus]
MMDNWKVLNLGDISDIKRGLPSQDLNYVDSDVEGVRLIRINDFKSDTPKYIKESEKTKKLVVSKGDILIAGTGATAGISFLVEELWDGLPFSYNAPRIKVNKGNSSQFVYYVLNSEKIKIQQNKLFTGNAQPFLDTRAIASFKIPIPPLPEQQKIADILSTVDAKIDIIDLQITETQELKKGLMQRLLTKGIGHTEFKDSPLGRIPKSWEVVRLNQVGDIVTGTTPKTSVREYYTENGVLWASPADLGKQKYIESTNKQLTNLGFQQTRKLPPKSIMVTCIGSTIGKIGMTNSNMSTNQQINSIVCNESNCPEFYYYLIEKIAVYIKSLAGTQAVPLLNKTDFSAINVVNPPMQEQKIISEILKTLDEKTEILSEKKETYQVLKQGLMQQLLTGKIRVKV